MSSLHLTSLVETFFSGMGIQIDDLSVTESVDSVDIVLKTPDSSILIGMHGKNMIAIRHFLGRMIEKHKGEFFHVHLEVNDYMKEKEERLFRFLDKKIAIARSSGGKVAVANLDSFERKKAHNYIQSLAIDGLSSMSEGEKQERTFFIVYTGTLAPKTTQTSSSSLTLDEEGIGI